MPRSRLFGSALLLSSLVLSLLASPVGASGRTRWVDDDGKAGTTSCSGIKTAYTTIQKGVNASGPGDTVKVCPGTYVGTVTIKGTRTGLVLRSVTTHGATIKAVDEFDASAVPLVTIKNVSDVTIKGFKIRPLLATSHSYCSPSDGIVAIGAKHLSITGNDIRPTGSGQFCGLEDGVVASGGTTGAIAHNVVKDYRDNGIAAIGADTKVTISDNTITFAHLNFPSATAQSAILMDDHGNAAVRGNTLNGPAAGPGNPSQPAAGIGMYGTTSATSVHDNTIARFAADIRISGANGGHVYDNTLTGGQVGIDLLDGDSMEIDGNHSSAATVHGLYVAGPSGSSIPDAQKSTNDNVHDNDLRTNSNGSQHDCQGESAATIAAGNGNSFDQNKGNTSSPAALCDFSVPVP